MSILSFIAVTFEQNMYKPQQDKDCIQCYIPTRHQISATIANCYQFMTTSKSQHATSEVLSKNQNAMEFPQPGIYMNRTLVGIHQMATHYGSPPISHNNTEQRLVATVQYYYYYQKAGMTSYPSMTNELKG